MAFANEGGAAPFTFPKLPPPPKPPNYSAPQFPVGQVNGPVNQFPGIPGPVGPAGGGIVTTVGGGYAPQQPLPTPEPLPGPPPGDPGPGPAPAPPPGAPGGYTPPGYAPDPSIAAQQAAQAAWATSAARNAVIAFGDPALAGMAGFGFDPQDAAFAQQNYLSGNATLARLNKAHDLRQRAVINQLAGHGILNSGDMGYLSSQEGQQYGNEQYDARLALLNYLSQLFAGNAQQNNTLRQKLLSDQLAAAPTIS